ncbi:hypothetical protein Ami103574_03055 [Aminipila butyrica]|uniref:Uncharacterized protein n=1 Tax=Aminipila butyrica TaxID=433296 RepID=A0A858BU96_9FIRM|nr:hypothetical protein [Aminipila butyrica]QIB68354.1 hypothetical protein Ami103574_03055 [Aminipila butyrica]
MRLIGKLQGSCIPTSQLNFIFQSRTAWRDMSTWIRAYLASKHGGLGDTETIRNKLKELTHKYVGTFSMIFGEHVAEQYILMLTEYMDLFDKLIDAQIQEDQAAIEEYTRLLYANTDQRAAMFASLNPYWSESEWKNLLYQFNQKTIDQSTTFHNKEFRQNVEIFDSILNLTSLIGDYFSSGMLSYLTYSGR